MERFMGVTLEGNEINLEGYFLKAGDLAPDFILASKELETMTMESFPGKKKVIATMPSIDTEVCAAESVEINRLALSYPSILFLIVTKDLPFALDRFCANAQLNNIIPLSDIRRKSNFAKNYGVKISSGPLDGLLARSVLLLDQSDKVLYSELCSEIKSMPDFKLLKEVIEGSL